MDSIRSCIVAPGKTPDTVIAPDGVVMKIPPGWELLPPGDAGLTRRVKAATDTWTVQVKKGRKLFSQGVWAAANVIAAKRAELEKERATEAYAKRKQSDLARRERKQEAYVESFEATVFRFLDFHPCHLDTAKNLAKAVSDHATPVGSGTVARTERIPIEERAEAAVIAWMRHQTTAYDNMKIPRVRGERREVRRMLAQRSRQLLESYRKGESVPAKSCPLQSALQQPPAYNHNRSNVPPNDC
ncbi:hypothetical protein VN12_15410 [Pirellula sp. SH-Sr6A]|uniref:DUF2293 domain-containing protein n=1 Tax=Pirellula sp. SH-Sr6A TaxID=1632865 RepID=UPI00078D8F3D|nr:DUF2293 domain-containing protein [Pirellula sp. SH-Sr6A]AMV33514.1 hypothetical protein VN12_15410 [Pirellula sp. SH-Sr6A]